MRTLSAVALLALVAFSAPASAQESRASNESVLSPGDSVRIVVWRKPEFSGDFVVAPNGTITHPLYRSVTVGGVPFATAEANLRRFLARFEENPEFVMEPLIRVAISGEVEKPQVFALRPETTIAEAIARAGGTTGSGCSASSPPASRISSSSTSATPVPGTAGFPCGPGTRSSSTAGSPS